MTDNSAKAVAAREIAAMVKNGETIGVGTGSTVDLTLVNLAERVRSEGLKVRVVPSSSQSAWRCQEIGLDVLYPGYRDSLAWGFDGADQVDPQSRLIKGKGGAMLQEKILCARCERFYIAVDDSKLVDTLGKGCPIPVEVVPQALVVVERRLKTLGASAVTIRPAGTGKHGPVITEAGNLVLDAQFDRIPDSLETDIKSIVGVVESGLFIGYADEIIIAGKSGVTRRPATRR